MPTTAQDSRPLSMSREPSVRMPQIFFPPISTSLTHLICVSRPDSASTASATATAAQAVRRTASAAGSCGRSSRLRYSPEPGGE